MDFRWLWNIVAGLVVVTIVQISHLMWLTQRIRSNRPSAPMTPILPDLKHDDIRTEQLLRQTTGPVGRIVVLSGVPEPGDIPLPSGNFAIGRFHNESANILLSLDEKSVSRRHANFIHDEVKREYYLKDTNSSYGTHILIDDEFQPLSPEGNERIFNEDVVRIGNVVKIRFVLPCETRALK